ncbi:MAG: SCO7613 C-terminal domain-containing membrane protein [Nocardioidaceae bacterium]
MTRYADPERCPDCLAPMPFGTRRCPSCGLSLEGPLAARLFTTLSAADELLSAMRAPTTPAAAPARVTTTAAARPAGGVDTLVRPEAPAPSVPGPGGPTPPEHHHIGLSGASVPKILLGLGALCLLIAALVFLAVAWSAMGVAGRTATLLGFTAVAGGLSAWAAHRDLRAAAESLGVVALGLLTFDLFGARDAGWFGDIATAEFFVLLGVVVGLAGAFAAIAVRRTPVGALVGAEVFATLGVACAASGLVAADWFALSAALTLAVVLTAAAALAAHTVRMGVLSVGAVVVSVLAWLTLAVTSWDRAVANPSLGELWADLEVWPLLVTAALAGALALVGRLPLGVRVAALGVAVFVLAGAALAPFTDESVTERTAAGAVLVLVVSAATWFAPQPWRRSLGGPVGLGLLWMAVAAWFLASEGLQRMLDAGSAVWSGNADDSFTARLVDSGEAASWLLPVVVVAAVAALVAVARSFAWADRVVAPLLDLDVVVALAAATALLTLALYPVPMWLVTGALLAATSGFLAVSMRRQHALPLSLAAVFVSLALVLALHAEWLTLMTLVVVLTGAAVVHLRWSALEVSVGAGALVSGAVAALVWTIGSIAGSSPQWTAVVALLALAAVVLGGPYVDERLRMAGPAAYARLGTEGGALVAAGVVSTAAVDLASFTSEATWAAVYLTLSGAAVSAMALLRPDRRVVGWLGGVLLVLASWVRLADVGVDTPEAYTLPSAVALLVVGLVHLRRNPGSSTMAPLTPGLALALVPSLLWVLAEPIALRSVLLGAACLGLVLGGIRLRWSAPVVHGAWVGTLLVLRLATPVADAVPRWALIGAAGVLLVAMGITWEQRVRDARRLAGYVHGLR